MAVDSPEAIINRMDKSIAVMDERILYIYQTMEVYCKELADHEERIDCLECTRDKQSGAYTMVGFLSAGLLAIIAYILGIL
jgi:hypothetical protein